MNQRQVIVSIPTAGQTEHRLATLPIDSPYKLIDTIRPGWRQLPTTANHSHHQTEIDQILPIHNVEGLRDVSQIATMTAAITADQHLLDSGDLPNVKLIVAPDGRLLLFDGHHSLLAYYQQGRRYLAEVPHILILSADDKPVTATELLPFFPAASASKILNNWADYVVNWQRPETEQLEKRNITHFGELAQALAAASSE